MRRLSLSLLVVTGLIVFSCKEKSSSGINLEELTISEIHQAYSNSTFNSEELVEAYIKTIEESDEAINAISVINPMAVEKARALDKEYRKTGILRPLHGIPIVVKDNINTIGLPTTAGALALKNFIPKENAFIIQQLENAGAIVLAKTNMAEWAFSAMHSESSTVGTTRNPYNLEYVPAGSSGGTGASVAANFALGGLGTDTGNSIRGPSSHNALVGFRTTLGLISREGIVPLFLRNDVVGPMCRTVEDATRMMEIMVGVDPKDPLTNYSDGKTETNYLQYLDKNGLQGARIGVLRELSDVNTDSDIKVLFDAAIEDLRTMGAEVIDPLVVPNFAQLRQNQWCAMFRKDVEDFLQTYVKNDTIQTLEDIIRIGTTSAYAKQQLRSSTSANGRWGDSNAECLNVYLDEHRVAFRAAIESVMDSLKLDAIIYPSWNNRPARIDQFAEEYKGDNNQVISPHTGQPAFTVPMGYNDLGLPAGLQFLGRMYDEPTLIRLTYAYEQGTKWRRAPILNTLK